MLFKLSLKNIKKSFKDYSVYFFTLIFAVAMFYMFNSLDAQESMLVLTSSKRAIIETLVYILNYVSIFVSVILGFLIVYSNNFLIKKRKKEIGLYFTLGMSKRKVSTILVIETIIIGLLSLGIGLVCGIGLSQFISIFTSKMFEVNMTSFKFAFSATAFYKTILYFGIIFVLVMFFNIVTLSRYKLIDLLTAGRKNEQVKIRNKYVTIITFILSIGLIGYAYKLLFDGCLLMMDNTILIMLACGAVGTFLLFFSLSGFLLKVLARIKSVYYRGLNIFTLKQVNSKINTTVISTTIISLMLLLTIGILSGSMSMARVFNEDFNENNLTDFTVSLYPYTRYKDNISVTTDDIENDVKSINGFNDYMEDYVFIKKYHDPNLINKSMMEKKDFEYLQDKYGSSISLDYQVPIISESTYKNYMNLINKEAIDIKDNEYILLANIDMVMEYYKDFYQNKRGIIVDGTKLVPASKEIIDLALENYSTAGNDGVVVVSDNLIKNLESNEMALVGNYKDVAIINGVQVSDLETKDSSLFNFMSQATEGGFSTRTRSSMETAGVGIKAIITFVGLYLGITFAISSATVLAIGQLSESSDNKGRFKILRQLGADEKTLNKTLFTQIAIVFIFPLIVALIHSIVGLKEINGLISTIGNIDLASNIALTTLFIVIVYGGYLLVTYLCSKRIIKE